MLQCKSIVNSGGLVAFVADNIAMYYMWQCCQIILNFPQSPRELDQGTVIFGQQ